MPANEFGIWEKMNGENVSKFIFDRPCEYSKTTEFYNKKGLVYDMWFISQERVQRTSKCFFINFEINILDYGSTWN